MNKVILIGRLTRDPELRYTSSNRAVTQIGIAISRPFANQNGERETDYINVVVWDKQAENVKNYLNKGRLVAVEGRLQSRTYDDKEGKKVYVTEVIASNVQFLESKNSGSTNQPNSNNNTNNNKNSVDPYDFNNSNIETTDVDKDPFANFNNSIDISDNDLPF